MKSETFYLNLLYGRGDFYYNFNKFLEINNGDGFYKLLRLCNDRKTYSKKLCVSDMFSKHFCGGLRKCLTLNKLSLEKLVVLAVDFIVLHKQEVNEFLYYKKEFEYQVLTKNYNSAECLLLRVYQEFGISLWLLDNISLLNNLYSCGTLLTNNFEDLEKAYFNIFNLKNNINEKHNHYVKNMKQMISGENFEEEEVDFLRYLLFVSNPRTERNWYNIIGRAYGFSFIDLFLVVEQFLLWTYESGNIVYKKCYNEIIEVKSIEGSSYKESEEQAVIDASRVIEMFEESKFENVISSFFSNESRYYNYFGAYKLAALSCLFLDKRLDSSDVLSTYIVFLMYIILEKDEYSFISAINKLLSIARILRTFQIHKGLCMFLEEFAAQKLDTLFYEQLISSADIKYINDEYSSENILLFPCKSKIYKVDDHQVYRYIDNVYSFIKRYPNAEYFFKEAYYKNKIDLLIKCSDFIQATKMFVLAYAENKLLVFSLNPTEIVKNLSDKIKNEYPLSLEELCYVFIDSEPLFIDERRNCFLNFFDNSSIKEPLELIGDNKENDPIILFFLNNICNKEMLPNLYRRFKSTEAAERYRLQICEFLLSIEGYTNKKDLLIEVEKITKTRALSKKLKDVETSRVTINSDYIKNMCYDELVEEIDAYNVTRADSVYITAIVNGVPVFKYTNRHFEILAKIYSIYAKEFCFGDQGIDLSLSTRVRHGAFVNQILKAFTDNNLTFNGHGRNDYFDGQIENKNISPEISKVFLRFSEKIKNQLDYFTQHILKVVLDKPIEDAAFRYDIDECDLLTVFEAFIGVNNISFTNVVFVLNDFLLNKTNEHLTRIKNDKLPLLLQSLIDEIDSLSSRVKEFILKENEHKIIERLFINCKTEVQNAFEIISEWFSLSEYNDWENYSFKELTEACNEITKSLFIGFNNLIINCNNNDSLMFKGYTFRDMVDVLLIVFNNAILHSGYKEQLQSLNLKVDLSMDSNFLYVSFENNLSDSVDLEKLDLKILDINENYLNKSYLRINTRQEGGMGLYKIMHTMFSVLKLGKGFYISRQNNIFRLEIKIKKEILVDEKSIDS